MPTEGQKDPRLIEDPPHLGCYIVDHVLPSTRARVAWVALSKTY
jgi:hypothetical protein